MSLFSTGIRPVIDEHLEKLAEEHRDYGNYWPASSAGYCMRKVYFDRLQIPYVNLDPRKQRVFTSGHIFHQWIQGLTKEAGLSIAQETELKDERLKVLGHIDDLVQIDGKLILYDFKTQNSRAFNYKRPAMSHYHRMQLATYMYMLRKDWLKQILKEGTTHEFKPEWNLTEARILKISKDDLRMTEEQLLWTPELEAEVLIYWDQLNVYWKSKEIPPCTCADKEGGFMARENYNPYFYEGEPCSTKWYEINKEKVNA